MPGAQLKLSPKLETPRLAIVSVIAFSVLLLVHPLSATSAGLKTRDQNPMLQSYYLPGISGFDHEGWHTSHSLFITNSFHKEQSTNETLVIDAENYRYDFTLAYQQDDWRFESTIPFIATESGRLDGLIENWHDLLGLPQNGRELNPDDRLNIRYTRDGKAIFLQDQAAKGLGDIAISASFALTRREKLTTELSLGIELPSAKEGRNLGNNGFDFALWLSQKRDLADNAKLYWLFGLSRPDRGGQLKQHLKPGVWLGQFGFDYRFDAIFTGMLQFDAHSSFIRDTALDALGNSLQVQIGLKLNKIIADYDVVLFFSEDILVGTAPDITFALRFSKAY